MKLKILAVIFYLLGIGLALGLGIYILLFDKFFDQPFILSRGFILLLLVALILMVIGLQIKKVNEANKNKPKKF